MDEDFFNLIEKIRKRMQEENDKLPEGKKDKFFEFMSKKDELKEIESSIVNKTFIIENLNLKERRNKIFSDLIGIYDNFILALKDYSETLDKE